MAARNVQTIHTSVDYGTLERDSHQDWLMGDCGIDQPASPSGAVPLPFVFPQNIRLPVMLDYSRNNHIICPAFYINAFENKFLAVPNQRCGLGNKIADPIPEGFAMGYMQQNKEYV